MSKTRIAVEIQIEMDVAEPSTVVVPLLRALVDRVAAAPEPLELGGEARASEGTVRWKIQCRDRRDLVVCAGS